MASRLVQTILAVHAKVAAASAITAAGARVELGPVVSGDPSDTVWVGYDGDPEGEFRAGRRDSEWVGLGAKKRDESTFVTCAITTLAGDGDVTAALTRIDVLFDALEDSLRADPSLGQSPTPFVAAVDDGDLFMDLTTAGLEPRLVFTVAIKTRI